MGKPESFLQYVGRVAFPRNPTDLTSTTQCPACFTPLTGQVCATCGLDLRHPAAAELATLSTEIAGSLERRLELIGRIRFETAAAPAAVAAASVAATVPAPPAPVGAAPVAAPPAAPVAPVDATPRRHFGVQAILLIVGVALLSIGAIFFLVYAFITFGLVWRSVIIGAVTVAAFVGASLLQRRKLNATAEAIGALAVVFVYLDAFAVRANDLFGAGSTEPLTYWGIVLVLSGIGFLVWHRLSGLRVASLVGYTAFGPGIALFLAGITEHEDAPTRAFAAFAGLAAGGLIHLVALRRTDAAIERVITLSLAVVGFLGASLAAFGLDRDWQWTPTLGLATVAVIALAHVVLLARTGPVGVFGPIIASLGAVAAASAVFAGSVRSTEQTFTLTAPVIAATVVALVLEFVHRRVSGQRGITLTAAVSAAVVAGALALPALTTATVGVVQTAFQLISPGSWKVSATEFTAPLDVNVAAVVALAVVVALVVVAWAAGGTLTPRRNIVLWAVGAVVVLAVPLLGVLWAVVAAWLVLAAAGVAALVVARLGRFKQGGVGLGIRLPVTATAGAALGLGYLASWASLDTWWIGSIATVLVLLAARLATSRDAVRATLLLVSVVIAIIAAAALGWRINDVAFDGESRGVEAVHIVAILGIVLLAIAAVLRGRVVSALDTRVLFWSAFVTSASTAAASWALGAAATPSDLASLVLPEFGTSLALGVSLLAVLLLWVLLPRTAPFLAERIVASIAVAPAVAWSVDSLIRVFALPEFVTAIAPISGALLVGAGSLAAAVLRPDSARWARDTGIGLVAVPAVFSSVTSGSDAAWLVLLLAGVTTLLLAVSRDGLVGSDSPRKHLGWLALALGTAGLWWRLAENDVTDLEPYVLPLAGALLLVALFAWRASRATPSLAAPAIGLAGLIVGVVPIAAASITGSPTRAIIIAAISAALVFLGTFGRGTALRPWLDAAAIAGTLGIATAGFGRPIHLVTERATDDLAIDVWLGGTLLVLLIGALAIGRLTALRGAISQVTAGVAFIAVLVVEAAALEPGALGTARAMTLVLLFCAVHVVGFIVDRPPFTRALSWVAIGLAAVAGIVGLFRDVIDPLEWATVPVALSLLVTGVVELRRNAAARSWPWLAPGILVLLLPSLIATFVEQPVWRLVALGVACVVLIVVGATRRLQAPLILGSVIVLIHAIRTFAPQIRQVYELTEWWVWAVVGGLILLFLGLTFEKRVRDLKAVTTRFSSLR